MVPYCWRTETRGDLLNDADNPSPALFESTAEGIEQIAGLLDTVFGF
jgi:hypothetical protein